MKREFVRGEDKLRSELISDFISLIHILGITELV